MNVVRGGLSARCVGSFFYHRLRERSVHQGERRTENFCNKRVLVFKFMLADEPIMPGPAHHHSMCMRCPPLVCGSARCLFSRKRERAKRALHLSSAWRRPRPRGSRPAARSAICDSQQLVAMQVTFHVTIVDERQVSLVGGRQHRLCVKRLSGIIDVDDRWHAGGATGSVVDVFIRRVQGSSSCALSPRRFSSLYGFGRLTELGSSHGTCETHIHDHVSDTMLA